MRRRLLTLSGLLGLLVACSNAARPEPGQTIGSPTGNGAATSAGPTVAPPEYPGRNVRVDDPNDYFYSPLIPPDGIRPVYQPEFVSAGAAELQPDELVMGVAWGGEAKAYPVSVMRAREMVNDELAGIPILVTW